eukprot:scaffold78993_cov26-Tisochrysis_lutea.AAC.1
MHQCVEHMCPEKEHASVHGVSTYAPVCRSCTSVEHMCPDKEHASVHGISTCTSVWERGAGPAFSDAANQATQMLMGCGAYFLCLFSQALVHACRQKPN